MSVRSVSAAEAMARLVSFDTIVDARSPGEFALDRLPGAVNWPVLNDEERHRVGTQYKQVNAFEARKTGAALVARNIADHIDRHVGDKPRTWEPLIYCWRGGQRSGSLALVLGQIGFRVHLIEGGYKAWRAALVTDLDTLPGRLDFRVICGKTGSGKSRLLQALRNEGAQVLDLEALACHRGSVLGLLPGQPQPTQKRFESLLWEALRALDPSRPVFVEGESRKIGELRVPPVLIDRMRESRCLRLELPMAQRVSLLLEDYAFLAQDALVLGTQLDRLVELRGKATITRWKQAAAAGEMTLVVEELLNLHYDPIYLKSMQNNFAGFEQAPVLAPPTGAAGDLQALARTMLAGAP